MAARQKVKRGKKSVEVQKPGETEESRNRILMENLESQFKIVVEAVVGTRRALEEKIDKQGADLTRKIEALEHSVAYLNEESRVHSALLEKHSTLLEKHSTLLDSHSTMLTAIQQQLSQMQASLDRKADAAQLAALERRVEALERRIG